MKLQACVINAKTWDAIYVPHPETSSISSPLRSTQCAEAHDFRILECCLALRLRPNNGGLSLQGFGVLEILLQEPLLSSALCY